jgi:preprotein translocase subunit SecY
VLYAGLILGFAFFYTALVFNARETADNLKKSGAFIPGIRPASRPPTTSTRCSRG